MYGGYHIGNSEVYNPWSILNYAYYHKLKPYWISTHTMFVKAMKDTDMLFNDEFETLMKNGFIEMTINLNKGFHEQTATNALWEMLINAGYLTITDENEFEECRIEIPNEETMKELKNMALIG